MRLETLQAEMIAAMKNKDKARKDAISSVIAAVKKTAIDERVREDIPEELVDRVILKEMKTVQEMIDTCPKDREETLAEYSERLAVIKEFAPEMMDEAQIKACIEACVAQLGVTELTAKDKGSLMKVLMPKVKGKADGKLVNTIISGMLK